MYLADPKLVKSVAAAFVLLFSTPVALVANAATKGELRVRLREEPVSLSPVSIDEEQARPVLEYVTESLLTQDEDALTWRPRLAERWWVSADGRHVHFVLRENARFSDGRPVTAEDVKFSFDMIFNADYQLEHLRPYYALFERVIVRSAREVEFVAKQKYFGNLIQSASLSILPRHVYGSPKTINARASLPIGTGPYRIANWQRGRGIALERNPYWWGLKDRQWNSYFPNPRVFMQFVNEDVTAAQMLLRDEIDYASFRNDRLLNVERVLAGARGVTLQNVQNRKPGRLSRIILNLRQPLFADPRVREALNALVDREFLLRAAYQGHAASARGPWYARSEYAEPSVAAPRFDLARAARALDAAGWRFAPSRGVRVRDGAACDFEILVFETALLRPLTVFQDDAAKLGVRLRLRTVDQSTFNQRLSDRQFMAAAASFDGGWIDFDPFGEFHSTRARTGENYSGYANAEVDRWLEDARASSQPDVRKRRLRQIYARVAADQPYVFLFDEPAGAFAVSARVRRPRPFYTYSDGVSRMRVEDL